MPVINRVLQAAYLILDEEMTIRKVAIIMHISKSCIQKDLQYRLPQIDMALYQEVAQRLAQNQIRGRVKGGMVTQLRWKQSRRA